MLWVELKVGCSLNHAQFVRKIAGMVRWPLCARNRRGQAADMVYELALYTSGLVKQWATRKTLFPLKSKAINSITV